MKRRLMELTRQLHCLLGSARKHLRNGKDHGALAVAHVPLCALRVTLGWRFRQVIPGRNSAVLCQPPLGTPPAVWDTMLDGKVQRGAIRTGLPTRHDSLDECHAALTVSVTVKGSNPEAVASGVCVCRQPGRYHSR